MSIMCELDIHLKHFCPKCKYYKICRKEINDIFACYVLSNIEYYGGEYI